MEITDRQPRIGGNAVNYLHYCKTQLWFYLHNITMESTSESVQLGKLLHEEYSQGEDKDIVIDEISLDILRNTREIVEIKYSKEVREGHLFQVKYYLYYLKHKVGLPDFTARLTYPRAKKTIMLSLTREDEEQIRRDLEEIRTIFNMESAPVPLFKKNCKGCSYFDLCFS
jgi:CRISPR-associated exonuclease Cas4